MPNGKMFTARTAKKEKRNGGKKLRGVIQRSRGENRGEDVKKKRARALNRGNDRPWKLLNLKYLKR